MGSSDNNKIEYNNISEGYRGINLYSTYANRIYGNILLNCSEGINIHDSISINISGNTMIKNGIRIVGDLLEYWNTHFIDISNTVNNKPVYYWKNQTGGTIPIGAGEVILANCSNIIIINQTITDSSVAVLLGFSSKNMISGNNVSVNSIYGIRLFHSNENTVVHNNASNIINYPVSLWKSHGNTIHKNNASSNNNWGIYTYYSDNNNITYNELHSCHTDGINIEFSNQNNIAGNNISDSMDGILLRSSNSNIIDSNRIQSCSDGIYLLNSNSNNISSNYLPFNYDGLYLESSNRNILKQNNISESIDSNGNGIVLFGSNQNELVNNTLYKNMGESIYVISSVYNNITNNELLSNYQHGIYLASTYNNITGNTIVKSYRSGIFSQAGYNNIIGNTVADNLEHGLYLQGFQNLISENKVLRNKDHGIYLESSLESMVYHNNIINNTNQAYDDRQDNFWDNGYPSGGNYWSDYLGDDNFKGPNQNQPGSDGLGDTPYDIDLDSKDNYPLMNPYAHKPLENFLNLKQGWNLISIPLIQGERNLTRVLGSIDGWYDAVQWYDPMNTNDFWKRNKIGKPFGNDLNELDETMSFWIHITQPGDTIFLYNGTAPTVNQTIQLHKGWNMVGYPSVTSHNRTIGLNNLTFDTHVDAIQWFDASTKIWHFMDPDDSFVPGRGYWVHTKVDAEWEVPI
jgi:parallel beta-helix repeat protein